jgi:hypothetical protein
MRNRSIYDILNAPAVTPFLGKQCVTALGEGKSAQFTPALPVKTIFASNV